MGYILLILSFCLPAAVLGKDYFTAAVFEHRPRESSSHLTAREKISSNLEYYKKAVLTAAEKGADMILFNEYGLFIYPEARDSFKSFAESIPDPRKEKYNPCTKNAIHQHVLYTVSCLARENNMYVVVNMLDTLSCDGTCDRDSVECFVEKCSADQVFYNTNVVFDREGNIVARYHKMHPYFEMVNVPDDYEFVTFETSFGKFGIIICFDSVFREAVQLVKDHGIDTMLFSTFWFDDVLPLNAVEWQQAWALANGVNFLAANTQRPGSGSLGSGIFSKDDGALMYTYEPDGESKLLLANVKVDSSSEIPDISSITRITENGNFPKLEKGDKFPEKGYEKIVGPASDMYLDYRYVTSQTRGYTKMKLEKSFGELTACHEGFCCLISYSAEDLQEDFYLVSFNGTINTGNHHEWWEEVCMLLRCDPFDNEPCVVQSATSKTVFKSVQMKAQFSEGIVYSTVTKNKFRLAPKSEWSVKQYQSETILRFLTDVNEPLLKVGMLGRIYNRDPPFTSFYQY